MTLSALTLVAALSLFSQDTSPGARVDAIFKDYNSAISPGCAVAVFQDNTVLFKQAYGMANLDHDVRLSTASVFHVASLSRNTSASTAATRWMRSSASR